jgi:hypothetical protein
MPPTDDTHDGRLDATATPIRTQLDDRNKNGTGGTVRCGRCGWEGPANSLPDHLRIGCNGGDDDR